MISISDRGQQKLIKKADALSPATEPSTLGVARGSAKGSPTTAMIVVAVLFGLVFVAALSQGVIIFPGFLIVVWIMRGIKPPRVIAVTSQEIKTYSTSFWTSSPKELVSTSPVVPFVATNSGSTINLGGEAIKLSKKEYAWLVSLGATAAERS